jgi:hypothetical protein
MNRLSFPPFCNLPAVTCGGNSYAFATEQTAFFPCTGLFFWTV